MMVAPAVDSHTEFHIQFLNESNFFVLGLTDIQSGENELKYIYNSYIN